MCIERYHIFSFTIQLTLVGSSREVKFYRSDLSWLKALSFSRRSSNLSECVLVALTPYIALLTKEFWKPFFVMVRLMKACVERTFFGLEFDIAVLVP